jgi:hypothetical protein
MSIILQFFFNLTNAHWSIIKRIFQYITSTLDIGLVFYREL